jgi:hypothetical protein
MPDPSKPTAAKQAAALKTLEVSNVPHRVSGNKVTIDFRIQDLVNRIGGSLVAGHCNGCLGCTGCKN